MDLHVLLTIDCPKILHYAARERGCLPLSAALLRRRHAGVLLAPKRLGMLEGLEGEPGMAGALAAAAAAAGAAAGEGGCGPGPMSAGPMGSPSSDARPRTVSKPWR
jgi:hypothetical protein